MHCIIAYVRLLGYILIAAVKVVGFGISHRKSWRPSPRTPGAERRRDFEPDGERPIYVGRVGVPWKSSFGRVTTEDVRRKTRGEYIWLA